MQKRYSSSLREIHVAIGLSMASPIGRGLTLILILLIAATFVREIHGNDLGQPDQQQQQQPQRHRKSQPHIIIVVADCLGWGDVSFHGHGQIPTPNLDALALNGISFKQLYTQPTSSAARASLLTGKNAYKLGLQDMFLVAGIQAGLPLDHKILPQYLKELNYETHFVGKWHLGYHSRAYLPTSRGFDTFFGSYLDRLHYNNLTYDEQFWSNSSLGFDFHQNENPLRRAQGHHITTLLTARADAILKRREKPLFLVLSHIAPGGSLSDMAVREEDRFHSHIRHIEHEGRSKYAAVIQSLDASVGRLIESLDSAGILNNSVVLFMSATGGRSLFDQFHPVASSSWPLRGQRFSYFDGGIRSTALLFSPLIQDRGYASDKLYHIADWLPTFVGLAGGDVSNIKDLDGFNIWNSLSHQEKNSPRSRILHQLNPYQGNMYVARLGHYKIISGVDSLSAYHEWYPPQGEDQSTEHADVYMLKSRTYRVLSRMPGFIHVRNGWRRDSTVHCNHEIGGDLRYTQRIQFNLTQCQPEKEPCLFDVLTDPCELENLANDFPHHVKVLQRWANSHLPEVLPPQITVRSMDHFEPRADPRFHQGNWQPWTDDPTQNKPTK